jgi:hypothetical protein
LDAHQPSHGDTESYIPASFRSLLGVGDKFSFKITEQWLSNRFDRDHPLRFKTEPAVLKDRIEVTGSQWVEVGPSGGSRLNFTINVKVRIMGVGGAVAKGIANGTMESYGKLPERAVAYLASMREESAREDGPTGGAPLAAASAPTGAQKAHHELSNEAQKRTPLKDVLAEVPAPPPVITPPSPPPSPRATPSARKRRAQPRSAPASPACVQPSPRRRRRPSDGGLLQRLGGGARSLLSRSANPRAQMSPTASRVDSPSTRATTTSSFASEAEAAVASAVACSALVRLTPRSELVAGGALAEALASALTATPQCSAGGAVLGGLRLREKDALRGGHAVACGCGVTNSLGKCPLPVAVR